MALWQLVRVAVDLLTPPGGEKCEGRWRRWPMQGRLMNSSCSAFCMELVEVREEDAEDRVDLSEYFNPLNGWTERRNVKQLGGHLSTIFSPKSSKMFSSTFKLWACFCFFYCILKKWVVNETSIQPFMVAVSIATIVINKRQFITKLQSLIFILQTKSSLTLKK